MLYQCAMTQEPPERVAASFWKVRTTSDETRERSQQLVRGVLDAREAIDAEIVAVSKNWRLDRMATVDLAILRLGTYELMKEAETPGSVVIDEAIELAKRFSEAESPPFVNGILDAVMKRVRRASGQA